MRRIDVKGIYFKPGLAPFALKDSDKTLTYVIVCPWCGEDIETINVRDIADGTLISIDSLMHAGSDAVEEHLESCNCYPEGNVVFVPSGMPVEVVAALRSLGMDVRPEDVRSGWMEG